MKGRRLPDGTSGLDLDAGDYCFTESEDHKAMWVCNPEGKLGRVEDPPWDISENDDGTVTVVGSIWWDKPEGWHGFLKHGLWEQA